ncbi:phosphoglucan phosphatase DSP4, amyloplastic isoform X1 [Cryptomeria japonica]|uniref:phosphoglucan phosphatase DSP4, amyloplastic isoform X1 n=1 Tax=Cryptomeria japonica TaxID=3369 RepID=UPI0027DA20DA|nr:phosphoglucan phosphatase DSP4, amyloplastic isoform X1 [Cryptomeria japonica]
MALLQPLHRSYLPPKLSGMGGINMSKSSRERTWPNCVSERFQPRGMTSFVCLFQKVGPTMSKPSQIHQASSGVNAETSKLDESDDKSEVYSSDMSNAMGAVLTYRHELGVNYNFVLPDLIVGSCLQTPEDVDKLQEIGVGTIFCLQKDSDLDYFGVDITAIQERAKECDGIQHIRAEISRDFDPFDLRMKLPSVIAKLETAIRNGCGITYVHCTAGLGRAPAVALSYMYWILGYKLSKANKLLQNVRKCCPNIEAIKRATADIIIGGDKQEVILKWQKRPCTNVEVSGLDVGWDQRLPLVFDETEGYWVLHRDLPFGRYEYKYVSDGNWVYNTDELVTQPNVDGHVNNYIEVKDDHLDDMSKETIQRLMNDDADLTETERKIIRERLEALSN